MPGISSTAVDKRYSTTSFSSVDREVTYNNLTNKRSQEKGIFSDRRPTSPIERVSAPYNDDEERRSLAPPKPGSPVPKPVVKKKKKKKNSVTANLGGTRYEVIREMVDKIGYYVSKDEDPNCFLIWNDSFVSTDRISDLKAYQRINHFPGMGEICRKDCLARNMAKMAKAFPEDYNFVPKTWILPGEYSQFLQYARELKKKKKARTYIIKPSNGAMGNGIMLFRNPEKVPQNENMVVQEYLDKPFLIDGFKTDMRIYVLVTSCDPLKFFLFNDGLLRMSTEKYTAPTDSNLDVAYMHLTNYSVNKHNENYVKGTSIESGSKRTLKYFNEYLRKHDYDIQFMWRNITDLIIKTMIVAHPHVLHAYRMCRPGNPAGSDSVCFEILGFDVMLDRKLRPWLLEINRSPSFGTDEKLDYDIKSAVVHDSIKLMNIRISDRKRSMLHQKAMAQKRLVRHQKRLDVTMDDKDRKVVSIERRKEELKEILSRVRREGAREEHENRHCTRFKRIFPPEDKFRREKYASLLNESFKTFLSGRSSSLQKEIEEQYSQKIREEDILDMLAECEADEKDGKVMTSHRGRGPKRTTPGLGSRTNTSMSFTHNSKPLMGMPTLSQKDKRAAYRRCDDSSASSEANESSSDEEDGDDAKLYSRSASRTSLRGRPYSGSSTLRSRSHSRSGSGVQDDAELIKQAREREEEMVKRTLMGLNDMKIKFPGKTDDEAEYILDKLHENWKFHKPRIASYWLVKLDSIKRRKVIDIVRSNVRAMLQRTWKCVDVDSLRMNRIFSRVFNRLLWSHGQGLWNCFQSSGNTWETIFSKSTDAISALEMACCRRIVQLCRDCLLIVYQFAAEAKNTSPMSTGDSDAKQTNRCYNTTDGRPQSGSRSERPGYAPATMSQKMTRLYNKTQSLNSLPTS